MQILILGMHRSGSSAVARLLSTMGAYFAPGDRVDLIKMDIQGFELHALRGAARVLDDNPAIKLLLEFWPSGLNQAGASAEAFISFLRDRDFPSSSREKWADGMRLSALESLGCAQLCQPICSKGRSQDSVNGAFGYRIVDS